MGGGYRFFPWICPGAAKGGKCSKWVSVGHRFFTFQEGLPFWEISIRGPWVRFLIQVGMWRPLPSETQMARVMGRGFGQYLLWFGALEAIIFTMILSSKGSRRLYLQWFAAKIFEFARRIGRNLDILNLEL